METIKAAVRTQHPEPVRRVIDWVTSHRPKPILNLSYSVVPEIGPLIGLFDYPKSVSEILQDKV